MVAYANQETGVSSGRALDGLEEDEAMKITGKYEGDDHSERSWSKRLEVPLRFLMGGDLH